MSQFYTASTAGSDAITSIETENATPQFVTVDGASTIDFGISNLVLGSDLPNVTSGVQNVGVGQFVLEDLTSGTGNVSIGFFSGKELTSGQDNVLVGEAAGQRITTGDSNTFVGDAAGDSVTSGEGNTGIGSNALGQLTTGSNNIVISNGINSGQNISGSESDIICIGNASIAGDDSHTIRIGTQGSGIGQQNRAFMAGITGVTVAGSEPVGVDTNGQLIGLGFGTSGQVLTSNGAATSPTWQESSGGAWTFISSATASNDATIDFINLDGTYYVYKFVLTDIISETDNVNFYLRTSTDNGSTFDSGATDYNYSAMTNNTFLSDLDASEIVIATSVGNDANEKSSWEINLLNPSATSYTDVQWFGSYKNTIATPGTIIIRRGAGERKSAADVDAVRFLFSSGNIASGIFKVYGLTPS